MIGSLRTKEPIEMPMEYANLQFAYRLGRMLDASISRCNINAWDIAAEWRTDGC
jgi:hypothetical protein